MCVNFCSSLEGVLATTQRLLGTEPLVTTLLGLFTWLWYSSCTHSQRNPVLLKVFFRAGRGLRMALLLRNGSL